jgi:hypothetical protein
MTMVTNLGGFVKMGYYLGLDVGTTQLDMR